MNDHETQNRKIREVWAEIARRNAGSVPEPCPDAEIVSAYAAKMLSEAETARWETHFSVCAACQETLAALAAAEEKSAVLPIVAPVIPLAAAISAPASKAKIPAAILARRHAVWNWLVPGMAAVVVLAVWLGVRERPPAPVAPVEVAHNTPVIARENDQAKRANQKDANIPRASAPAAPESDRSEFKTLDAESKSAQLKAAPRVMAPMKNSLPKNTRRVFSAPQPPPDETFATPGSAGSRVADPLRMNPSATPAPKAAAPSSSSLQAAPPVLETRRKNLMPGPLDRSDERSKLKRAEQTQQSREEQQAIAAVTQSTADARPSGQMQREESKEKIESTSQNSEIRANQPARVLRERATAQNAIVLAKHQVSTKIFAPKRQTLWIVGPVGTIQRSTNGGLSVITQNSGVLADLLAGSAPSQTVCWVVGRAGTILLTIDSEHWARVGAPGDQDWIGVRATDALHAVIWDKDQHATFSTSDGGKTWKSLPQ